MSILSQGDLTHRICRNALLVTVSMMLSYLEALLPLSLLIPIPGIKLGLANVVTVLVFALFSWKDAAIVHALRILLMGLLFGSATSLYFSAAGGLLCFLVLALSHRFFTQCSYFGISVLCAAAHNIGQILAAVSLFGAALLVTYLPWLLLAAILSGSVTGMLLNLAIPRLQRSVCA